MSPTGGCSDPGPSEGGATGSLVSCFILYDSNVCLEPSERGGSLSLRGAASCSRPSRGSGLR